MKRLHLYIMKCVCDQFKITRVQLTDPENKAREIVIPRQIAAYLIKKQGSFLDEDINNMFHMNDPSWTSEAHRSIIALMQTDRPLELEIIAIERRLPYTGKSSKF